MCFVSYEDDVLEGAGTEWIFCKCSRWLHEDCVEDVVMEKSAFVFFVLINTPFRLAIVVNHYGCTL